MEITPKFAKMDFSDDSGVATASSSEISSMQDSQSHLSLTAITTPLTHNSTRKRKFPTEYASKTRIAPSCSTKNTPIGESPWDVNQWSKNAMSSTLNESKDIEKIITNSLTPNFYLERGPESGFWESNSKSQTAPSTPVKLNNICSPQELSYIQTKAGSNTKLGSPERYAIIYPEIKYFEPPYIPLTSQKLGESLRRSSPCKKRLFLKVKRERLDPVNFFINDKRRLVHVIENIFDSLPESDLYNVRLVSKKWKQSLSLCKGASKRVKDYLLAIKLNKENYVDGSSPKSSASSQRTSLVRRTPLSPKSKKYQDFMEIGKVLKPGQNLTKCPQCVYASIIDNNIGQCQNFRCGYIYCTLCSSFSTTGPENFIDTCQTACLVYEKPQKKRTSIYESPIKSRRDDSLLPIMNEPSSPATLDWNLDSPTFLESPVRRSLPALKSSNAKLEAARPKYETRSTLFKVTPLSNKKMNKEFDDPPSPPKVSTPLIGSKQSKKNLKRLLF